VLGDGARMDEALRKAFTLRNRASERENFDISSAYYQFITHQTDKTIEVCELWAQTYPGDFTPHRILGYENGFLGRWERSVEEFRKAMELDSSQSLPYSGQMIGNLALNRLDDARAVYQAAKAHHVHSSEPTRIRFLLAFVEGDKPTMEQMADLLEQERGFEGAAVGELASVKLYYGQVRAARELSQVSRDNEIRNKDTRAMRGTEEGLAFEDAMLGRMVSARQHANDALRLGGEPAMALALIGDASLASKVAEKWAGRATEGGFLNGIAIPELQAAVEIARGNPTRAVELLVPVKRYEAGWTDRYMAAYLRGQAFLGARRGPEAAIEFQKIIDHRGVVLDSIIGPLSHVGLARAYGLDGDRSRARETYEKFFDLWRDADKDLPILIAAKSEYAKLR
jgi:tetratricopeptide (TPR) repeat protein